MSTEIKAGISPVSISSHKNSTRPEQNIRQPETQTEPPRSADTVTMTEEVSRLRDLENHLAQIPAVNDTLVAEMSQAIADGSLEIDLGGIASKLIEMETGVIEKNSEE